jgi:hypothetical protein
MVICEVHGYCVDEIAIHSHGCGYLKHDTYGRNDNG